MTSAADTPNAPSTPNTPSAPDSVDAADRASAAGEGRGRRAGPEGGLHPPTKESVGMILCRTSVETHRPEVLLGLKRYTYAFAEFLHGRFARGRNCALPRGVSLLLEQMTTEELLDIWSLDYRVMWRRVWLDREVDDFYHKKHAKFQSAFMRDDGGAGLRRAIQQTRSRGACLWEVPKGRRIGPREPDIFCAVRELREETGIDKSEYRILPGVKRRVSFVSAGTRYVCLYYVAVAYPRLAADKLFTGRPVLRAIGDMGEISETRWHDIERVRLLDGAEARLESLVAPAFRLMKKYLKGQWATRRATAATLTLPPAADSGLSVLPESDAPERAVAEPGARTKSAGADVPAESDARRRDGARGGAGEKTAAQPERPTGPIRSGLSPSEESGWRRVRRGRRARGPGGKQP